MPLRHLLPFLVVFTAACLPRDTRDPPGTLQFMVRGSEAIGGGARLTFVDGWTLSLESFAMMFSGYFTGSSSQVGPDRGAKEGCEQYSNRFGSNRLVDALDLSPRPAGVVRGLGPACGFGAIIAPFTGIDLVVASTLKPEAVTTMVRPPQETPPVVYVHGTATRGPEQKTLRLVLRTGQGVGDCTVSDAPRAATAVALTSEATTPVLFTIHGEVLFSDRMSAEESALRFDPFARADSEDGDGDGEITMEDLDGSFLSQLAGEYGDGRYTLDPFVGGPPGGKLPPELRNSELGGTPEPSLATFVTLLVGRMFEVGSGGRCTPQLNHFEDDD
jgi:hypothetical protein